MMKSWANARFAAASISSLVAPGRPTAMLARTVSLKRMVSLGHERNLAAQILERDVPDIGRADADDAAFGIVKTQEEIGKRSLCCRPLAPTRATIWPALTSKLIPRRTGRSP